MPQHQTKHNRTDSNLMLNLTLPPAKSALQQTLYRKRYDTNWARTGMPTTTALPATAVDDKNTVATYNTTKNKQALGSLSLCAHPVELPVELGHLLGLVRAVLVRSVESAELGRTGQNLNPQHAVHPKYAVCFSRKQLVCILQCSVTTADNAISTATRFRKEDGRETIRIQDLLLRSQDRS